MGGKVCKSDLLESLMDGMWGSGMEFALDGVVQ